MNFLESGLQFQLFNNGQDHAQSLSQVKVALSHEMNCHTNLSKRNIFTKKHRFCLMCKDLVYVEE